MRPCRFRFCSRCFCACPPLVSGCAVCFCLLDRFEGFGILGNVIIELALQLFKLGNVDSFCLRGRDGIKHIEADALRGADVPLFLKHHVRYADLPPCGSKGSGKRVRCRAVLDHGNLLENHAVRLRSAEAYSRVLRQVNLLAVLVNNDRERNRPDLSLANLDRANVIWLRQVKSKRISHAMPSITSMSNACVVITSVSSYESLRYALQSPSIAVSVSSTSYTTSPLSTEHGSS
ncbi:unknown [Eggerthella sp. CAG:209]|nr:unknown [Eggerthella sp. CAG:209]